MERTLNFRHNYVRLLAPKLWKDWRMNCDSLEFERPMISFLKEYYGNKPLVGCEVGVREGINTDRILRTLNIKKLYLVDPYLPYYEPSPALTVFAGSAANQENVMKEAKRFLSRYNDRIVWLRKSSDDAVTNIHDALDFCYIDGDHCYNQVRRDIDNYEGILNKGGVIGGHDFATLYLGLCRAVLENKDWFTIQGKNCDWWKVK